VQSPPFLDHQSWCKGFDKFLDKLGLPQVHLFGTSLGGYLAQCFTAYKPEKVGSLILCNTYADTQHYKDNAPCAQMFPFMPDFVLKRMILSNFPQRVMEAEMADSVDFMVQQLETLAQSEIASRLTLNCSVYEPLKPAELKLDKTKVTIMDTLDEVAVPEKVRDEVYKFYPDAKLAELKNGGNFPYLSRPDEVNMYLQVHLRNQGVIPNPLPAAQLVAEQVHSKEEEEEPLQPKERESVGKQESDVPEENKETVMEETVTEGIVSEETEKQEEEVVNQEQ